MVDIRAKARLHHLEPVGCGHHPSFLKRCLVSSLGEPDPAVTLYPAHLDDPTGWANSYIELLESYDPDRTVESIRNRFCRAIPAEIAQHWESYLVTAGLQGREVSVADYIYFFEDEAGFFKDRQRASHLRRAENYSRSQPRDLRIQPRTSQSSDRSRPQRQFAGDRTPLSTRGQPDNNRMRSVHFNRGTL
jgi:hypothetical protein